MAQAEDRRLIATRLTWLQAGSAAVFVVLAFSVWFLQVVDGDTYRDLAENNHQRTLSLRAARGVLYDRNFKVLVDSRPSLNVLLDRERTKDVEGTIELLARVAGIDPEQMRQAVDRHKREPRYRPVPLP